MYEEYLGLRESQEGVLTFQQRTLSRSSGSLENGHKRDCDLKRLLLKDHPVRESDRPESSE